MSELPLKFADILSLRKENFCDSFGRALHYLQDYSIDPTEKLWIFSYRSITIGSMQSKN